LLRARVRRQKETRARAPLRSPSPFFPPQITESALDRHIAAGRGDLPAVTWETDDGTSVTYSFRQVLSEVCAAASLLASRGVRRGDVVTLYLPMVPQLLFSMLACARLGAVHSVVFAGFSDAALAERIVNGGSTALVTADAGLRGGRVVPLKAAADRAVALAAARGVAVTRVFVTHRAGAGAAPGAPGWVAGRDIAWDAGVEEAKRNSVGTGDASVAFAPTVVDAEDPLFILYTSGSTGAPKGLVHTVGGYMVYAGTTFRHVFDAAPRRGPPPPHPDTHFCAADLGWVTGHTYIGYGPLLNGTHSVLFEGTPLHPGPDRLWATVAKHRATSVYVAPTAIRSLMVHGDAPPAAHDLSSLRVIGSVGEPIGPEAWGWFHRNVGRGRAAVVDTYWQTETGGCIVTGLPGATPMKPGAATRPFFGVDARVVKADGSPAPRGEAGFLVLGAPWPGIARTVWRDHARYVKTYFSDHPGFYFTGDAAVMDEEGDIRIIGRTDDVINVSGHRLGTAEVEAALGLHSDVAEAAVVGFPHAIKGEGIYAYVTLKTGKAWSPALRTALVDTVRKAIGPIATPDVLHHAPELPKTRSGKIMRRM
jgi:acetyl-CoA synthetase